MDVVRYNIWPTEGKGKRYRSEHELDLGDTHRSRHWWKYRRSECGQNRRLEMNPGKGHDAKIAVYQTERTDTGLT